MFSQVIVTLGIIGTLAFAMSGCRKSQPKFPPEEDTVKTAAELTAELTAEAEDEITEENLDQKLDRLEKEIDADIATQQ